MGFTFIDVNGKPVARTEDGIHVFLFNGRAVAYIDDGSIYSYSGTRLGSFKDGWIKDSAGDYVFSTRNAWDENSGKDEKPKKSAKSSSWSKLSGEEFFYQ